MAELAWNWLCVPYIVCALSLVAVGGAALLIRGDRVLRLGTIGAATSALPWAACSALTTCTRNPETAERLLRLGNGPASLVGPSLLLVLLGVSGQLERFRWIARVAGVLGFVSMVACWASDWTVAGVHQLPARVWYISPGPLTVAHFSQIGVWLGVGVTVVRRSTSGGERRRIERMLVGVLALATLGATDLLLVYDIAGWFPIAWFCASVAAGVAFYFEIRTDLLRPQGFDRDVVVEAILFATAVVLIAAIALVLDPVNPVVIGVIGAVLWAVALGIAWATRRSRPVRVAREHALDELVAELAEVDSEATIAERLGQLWGEIGIGVRRVWRVDGDRLHDVAGTAERPLDAEVASWLVDHDDAFAAADLGTMRLGALRPKLEALVAADRATLVVPLVDRGALVGMIDAEHGDALREDERGMVAESAHAAGRALAYLRLSRAAAEEHETAREVEVAEAMRLQATAGRDDELGVWAVAADYRTAPRSTGAGWTATLLADGKLALLVTEAQAHGVAAALATAAVTGAFAAATASPSVVSLDQLVASLRASAEGVVRGGEPIAAFIAILDPDAYTVGWACAGHPGASLLVRRPQPRVETLGGGGARLGASTSIATRGVAKLGPEALLVIASSQLRGEDDSAWFAQLGEHAGGAAKLATTLVESVARQGTPREDLLAVVVRRRPERHSEPVLRPIE
jgi:hypothetical protein